MNETGNKESGKDVMSFVEQDSAAPDHGKIEGKGRRCNSDYLFDLLTNHPDEENKEAMEAFMLYNDFGLRSHTSAHKPDDRTRGLRTLDMGFKVGVIIWCMVVFDFYTKEPEKLEPPKETPSPAASVVSESEKESASGSIRKRKRKSTRKYKAKKILGVGERSSLIKSYYALIRKWRVWWTTDEVKAKQILEEWRVYLEKRDKDFVHGDAPDTTMANCQAKEKKKKVLEEIDLAEMGLFGVL